MTVEVTWRGELSFIRKKTVTSAIHILKERREVAGRVEQAHDLDVIGVFEVEQQVVREVFHRPHAQAIQGADVGVAARAHAGPIGEQRAGVPHGVEKP